MTREQEDKLRGIVSGGQWSVSWAIVAALLVIVARVPTWEPLGWVVGWYIAGVGPVWLIAGMYLCWRLPDNRKWLVVLLEVIILLCGVAMIEWQLERGKDDQANTAHQAFLASPRYQTALDSYNLAKRKLEANAERLDKIPGDFTTGARENTASAKELQANFEKAKADLLALEPQIPKAPENRSVDSLFGFAGPGWEPWIKGVVLLLLALGDQAVAMANTWRRSEPTVPEPKRRSKAVPTESPTEKHVDLPEPTPEPEMTVKDYLRAATEGRTDGKLWGREVVAKKLGISERQVRKLRDELVQMREIIGGTSPKLAQMSGHRAEA